MNEEQFRKALVRHVRQSYRTQIAMAKALGIHHCHISMVINGHRKPCKKILADMGLTRKVTVKYSYLISAQ